MLRWTRSGQATYAEIGYDPELADELRRKEGWVALYFYWKEFECHAVERLLADPPGGVIDFGAGHSVHENDAHFARVAAALAPYPNVVLLLPSGDQDEALRVLHERRQFTPDPDRLDLNAHFLTHPSNQRLAKQAIYTDARTPDETCQQILNAVEL